jgi:A/G-specific adenine glycosylase
VVEGTKLRDGAGETAARLLAWYDAHARDLPWRVGPAARRAGARPDPYAVWLSEVMLQQTTVAAVRGYFAAFLSRWPSVEALAAAEDAEVMAAWAGLGYYARARNLLACAREVAARGGFPDTEAGLRALPGIGPYTGAAIAAIAFDRPAVVVDGNVERVMARLHAIEAPLPGAKPLIHAAAAALTPDARPGDHAQAVMDLGATICTPRSPSCLLCPLAAACAGRAAGIAARLPAKAPRRAKPERRGHVWLARRAGPRGAEWLLERRPPRGLLGGMLAFPTGDWAEAAPEPLPPLAGPWAELGEVRHTFTHFHLTLRAMWAEAPEGRPARGAWAPLDAGALPALFAKAHRLAPEGG